MRASLFLVLLGLMSGVPASGRQMISPQSIEQVRPPSSPGIVNNSVAQVMQNRADRLGIPANDNRRASTLRNMGNAAGTIARRIAPAAAAGALIGFGMLMVDQLTDAGDFVDRNTPLPESMANGQATPDEINPTAYRRDGNGRLLTRGKWFFPANKEYPPLFPNNPGDPTRYASETGGCLAAELAITLHCMADAVASQFENLRDINGQPVPWGVSNISCVRLGDKACWNFGLHIRRAQYRRADGILDQEREFDYPGNGANYIHAGFNNFSAFCHPPDNRSRTRFQFGVARNGGCLPEGEFLRDIKGWVPTPRYTFPNSLPADWNNTPLSPDALAKLVNEIWRNASEQPGYAGLPYSASDPITRDDVQRLYQTRPDLMPTVGDMVSPVASGAVGQAQAFPEVAFPANGTRTATDPGYVADPGTSVLPGTGTNPGTTPGTTPGTGTTPQTINATVDLGPDPNIGEPAADPTKPEDIINPWFNWFPTVTWPGGGQCPLGEFHALERDFNTQSVCDFAEQQRAALSAAFLVMWTLTAAGIVLRA